MEAGGYPGRLSARRRAEAQDRFMADEFKALVATNAFGLGIDKPDIRFVLHYHLPGTTEAFYQEFGRAGRDANRPCSPLRSDPADLKPPQLFLPNAYPTLAHTTHPYQPPNPL